MATADERISTLETKVSVIETKVDDFIEEMRDRDNRRAAENEEIRQSIREIYQTTDAKIDSIRQSIQAMQNQNVVVIIGVIAIAVAVFLK